MTDNNNIEIMAPAGSFASLRAAIQGGADSVYFGVEQLNMRAKSTNNFTLDDLPEIVKICSENYIKSYLTVNTIIYDHDLKLMRRVVDTAKGSGVTALIASDQGVINYANTVGVAVHISTQLNVSNIETLKFYAHFADVVVLARELSLRQVASITRAIENEQIKGPSGELMRIEIFAHGALCMAVSGKCYLSLHEQNASANRGACMQPCRKSYIVTEKESGNELEIDNEYIMSPKDLRTISFLDKILESGVRVLKLEGRARSPEYVKTVTQCYREAANACQDGTYTIEKIKRWEERLSNVYNRGFWDGYYLGRKLGEWSDSYGSSAKKRKIFLAKGSNYFSQINVGEFNMQSGDLRIGDDIVVIGPTTGVIEATINELRVDDKPVDTVKKGEIFSTPIEGPIRKSDKLYKLVEVKK
ncbi:MAG TPA: peptidase U32 family protein [Balneolales bacterium]|nr:peptidase U32 family protein [Balneolales bacterium]